MQRLDWILATGRFAAAIQEPLGAGRIVAAPGPIDQGERGRRFAALEPPEGWAELSLVVEIYLSMGENGGIYFNLLNL